MALWLLTEYHLGFSSLTGGCTGCTGSSESTLVKMPHCWKSHVAAQISNLCNSPKWAGRACADPGIFVGGGGGGGGLGNQVNLTKKSNVSLFFFLVPSLFYRSPMVNFKENYHFSRFQRGSNFFQGGGVQLLIPYRNPYNL